MINRNMSFVEFTIRKWFNDNRPDLRSELDNGIYKRVFSQIEPEIEGLDPTIKKVIIHEFLREKYPIELTEMVKEILSEQIGKYAETIQDWKNFAVYHAEVGEIMIEFYKEELNKKNITYDYDEIRAKILKIVKARIEREWE